VKTVFLRVLEESNKEAALLTAIRQPAAVHGNQRFEVEIASLSSVPGSPFAYWVSERLRKLFTEMPPLEGERRTAKQGVGTGDDYRFVRTWWEAPADRVSQRWVPFAKGGAFSRFYADVHLVVNWDDGGREMYAFNGIPFGGSGAPMRNPTYYFRPGLTWSDRTTRLFSSRIWPRGGVFSVKGSAGFFPGEEFFALGLLNSLAFNLFLSILVGAGDAAARSYQIGVISCVPWPERDGQVSALARRAWSLKRSLDTRTETSHAFCVPVLLQTEGDTLVARATAWAKQVRTIETELAAIQGELDARCFDLYGVDETDRRAITQGLGTRCSEGASSDGANDAEEDADENDSTADATGLAAELVSWAVGVAFGRFGTHFATGARPMPTEPEPFDPLPTCSPGMLTGGDGPPLAQQPAGCPLAFPKAGMLVNDRGHAQDLPIAVRAVFDAVFGAGGDRWLNEVAALLEPKGNDLRGWLEGSFFEHHLKRHSKSRRKAPIFWQLGIPSGRYSVWLYAHRLTRDSFFQLLNEVVVPKLNHEERQLTSLTQNARGSPSASERKGITEQETLVEELRAMVDEIKRIAPLWNPHLDDGVVLAMAPLWRLVPQHKSWQKELRAGWDELAAGKFDWAHLAMHLWPERVVPKCATDRSIAIAHGLEDVFWVEGSESKWQQRPVPTRSVDELVRARVSPSVKAALKSLLDATVAASNGRGRGRRSGTAAATGVNA
jgi:hypothetical protein